MGIERPHRACLPPSLFIAWPAVFRLLLLPVRSAPTSGAVPSRTARSLRPWTRFAAGIKLVTQKVDADLYGLGITPQLAIGQRSLLIRSEAGNVLWDCIPFLDDATVEWVNAVGGISAIAVSHPHFYSTMAEWSQTFQAPVYLHQEDRQCAATAIALALAAGISASTPCLCHASSD